MPYYRSNLALYIATPIINRFENFIGLFLLLLRCFLQVVFRFQIPTDSHRTWMVVIIGDFFTVNAYTGRNDMDMCAVNVRMFENNIGLIAVTHTFHILLCHFRKLLIAYLVFRVGVQ